MSFSATPAIAEKLKLETYYLIKHQAVFLSLSVIVMLVVSMQTPRTIRLLALLALAASFVLLVLVLMHGTAIKGSSRWIRIFGISVQPSEIAKPAFAVAAAWLFSLGKIRENISGAVIASLIYFILVVLLISQPDFGMTMTWI